ncbi:MAG TPA: hypothetical protein DHW71_08735 [Gammaproteobacteria bacterium]|nr:hypothetical protein [Pseudomonadota bacterium]HBF09986.1 hypothetical protein [Gammaproteobacteria bacterium]HCK93059.1 hypothetical protein [Gammaproteobacteria bacterium]|tara:strand:+ start:361 stop:795 length:435 start_codon:yes stop_codon:yes gene_type:complete
MSKHPVKNCLSCHFLAKKIQKQGFSQVETVTRAERTALQKHDYQLKGSLKDIESFHCFRKVWDERTEPGLSNNREFSLAEKDRDDQCFFFEYKPNLSFETAQQMRVRKKEVPRVEKFVLIGERAWLVWIISAAVLLASILYVKY